MMIVMSFPIFFKLSMIIFSLSLSIPAVASSNNNNLGFLIKALAIIILCFYPPERLDPFVSICI